MALTEVYVDPSIAGDSGAGTIGDPFGDLEYAIEQTTFDTTNGTRVNIKAGTDEVLAASLQTAMANTTTTPAWVPTESAPCIFQGYTSVQGDEGKGQISGGGSVSIMGGDALDYVQFIDLKLHNTGANDVVSVDNNITVTRCEIYNSSGIGIDADNGATITQCYIHDVTGSNAINIANGEVRGCYVDTAASVSGINALGAYICYNIVVVRSSGADGIRIGDAGIAINNSVYHAGSGTGNGIWCVNSAASQGVLSNLIEGFSGTGGVGVGFHGTASNLIIFGANAVYDCATAYETPTSWVALDLGDNETLTASPFTDAANGDFSPVSTGNVFEGSLPKVIGGGLV